jgi:hypothetical protein
MHLIFNHRFGRVEQQDLVVCDVLALPDDDHSEETDMLDSGWLALDRPYTTAKGSREVFYQCRSTRIDLYACKRRFPQHTVEGNRIEMKEIFPRRSEDTVWTGMHQLYDSYIQRKGFRNLYNPFEHINKRDSFLIYYVGDVSNLIGFTKIKRYQWQEEYYDDLMMSPDWMYSSEPYGIESVMHCNNQPISQITMDMEIVWAQKQGASHFYAGAGYEKSSIYKSQWKGFEWWDGARWSRSKRQYVRLCERDSSLRSIADLGDAK